MLKECKNLSVYFFCHLFAANLAFVRVGEMNDKMVENKQNLQVKKCVVNTTLKMCYEYFIYLKMAVFTC